MNSPAFDPGTDPHHALTVTVHGHVVNTQLSFDAQPRHSPMHTLITALGECALITLHGMYQRQRQHIHHYRCDMTAIQQAPHPQVFHTIHMHISISGHQLVPAKIQHGIALLPKYCPVHATLAHTSSITHTLALIAQEHP